MGQIYEYRHWQEALDPKFHHFNGAYHNLPDAYRVELKDGKLALQMSPPGKMTCFFDASEYAKRLVGNAYSVPVMEYLLKPLQQLFATHEYPPYQYAYEWNVSDASG